VGLELFRIVNPLAATVVLSAGRKRKLRLPRITPAVQPSASSKRLDPFPRRWA